MELKGKTVGFAMTGSFCTFARVIKEAEKLAATDADIFPIMSETAFSTDTRFGKAADFVSRLNMICGNPIIKSVKEVVGYLRGFSPIWRDLTSGKKQFIL